MKYEKPTVTDLGGRSASGGPPIPLACFSGGTPTEQCRTGSIHSGLCNRGELFTGTNYCEAGTGATHCALGQYASVVPEP
ncbi:MAG: hypothetical protein MUE60_02665 [Candidatus Eisenbacteria bacterium]|nr:hypothetical protein [Candidatus Eisenbacteria bacterium]